MTGRREAVVRLRWVTTGCKVNQADGEEVLGALSDLPVLLVGPRDPADLVVVNGCAVTSAAERDGRAHAHRGLREGSRVILTGCLAQRIAPEDASGTLPRAVEVLPATSRREAVVRRLREEVEALLGPLENRPVVPGKPRVLPARSRPLVKVQDGCDHRCAYCIVPLLRGPSRSVPLADAIRKVRDAASREGVGEVVLTGVDLASFGREQGRDLADLLEGCLSLGLGVRFRLSSLEPHGLTPGLRDLLAGSRDLCPHLHIPVQSGSPAILRAMGRDDDVGRLRTRLEEFAREVPDLNLGMDLLVGFPGETDGDFQRTLELVQGLPVSRLHVFPFSPRPGTRAATRRDRVDPEEVAARSSILRDLSRRRLAERARSLVGRVVEVVDIRSRGDIVESLAADYTRICRRDPAGPRPGRFPVRVVRSEGEDAWSEEGP
ncbi:MiaB/RimO family radical SAM methylthiotransferase [Myxococcota bacterium]|jgi:threonylcarbamoyladenosine tRNA methylthiotransferase MtaB|nr:MiaB/RimO family radical SAM methylthiotransferase [Myxococcota bacterium]